MVVKICDGLPRNRLRCLCENLFSSLLGLSVIECCVVVQLKTPLFSEDVTVLTPGSMAPSVPSADSGRPKKRRRRLSVDVSSTVLGMENCYQIIVETHSSWQSVTELPTLSVHVCLSPSSISNVLRHALYFQVHVHVLVMYRILITDVKLICSHNQSTIVQNRILTEARNVSGDTLTTKCAA